MTTADVTNSLVALFGFPFYCPSVKNVWEKDHLLRCLICQIAQGQILPLLCQEVKRAMG